MHKIAYMHKSVMHIHIHSIISLESLVNLKQRWDVNDYWNSKEGNSNQYEKKYRSWINTDWELYSWKIKDINQEILEWGGVKKY